ncbi:hypothetical protein ABZW96_00700 [Nocardia sp. NPDC004168]|uniref:hypothetical protein n=1 Tax=Nocardia TaxID=1817 RepID=UPI0033AA708E
MNTEGVHAPRCEVGSKVNEQVGIRTVGTGSFTVNLHDGRLPVAVDADRTHHTRLHPPGFSAAAMTAISDQTNICTSLTDKRREVL